MIDRLKIVNFKAFTALNIALAPYTLLSGLNSSGKSTVLQALALLRQTSDMGMLPEHGDDYGLPLNGELVELGMGLDVLNEDHVTPPGGRPEIEFALLADSFMMRTWRFYCGPEDDLLPPAHYDATFVGDDVDLDQEVPPASDFTLFNSGFQYLRADRINPATTYPRSHEMSVRRGFLGVRGEYAIDYLRYHQDDVVLFGALHHPAASSPRLQSQVEAWMSEICPGVRIQATALEKADLVQLGFQFAGKRRLTPEPQRPTNVGFGLTYVLPVIIACLTAQPGAMILLENPEAHIHPRGQSAMARLTCTAAAIGAQLVVETHSDHILNGVRLSAKREILPAGHVVLHYFRREDDGIHVDSPIMGADGMLSEWPPGFFDEWDRSLDQLLD